MIHKICTKIAVKLRTEKKEEIYDVIYKHFPLFCSIST